MAVTVQFRRGTAAEWTTANPTLLEGELGLELDTLLFKLGDGTTAWNSLDYQPLTGNHGVVNYTDQTSAPSAPTTGYMNFFSMATAGKPFPVFQGSAGAASQLQPALFKNNVFLINTSATTAITSIGNTVSSVGTISHPAASATYGYMANFASAATANSTAGTSSSGTLWLRELGWFFNSRLGFSDVSYNQSGASTGSRISVGMTGGTMTAAVSGDDIAAQHHAYFQRNHVFGARNDTNWQFATKDGSTQTVVDTGMVFAAAKVYDFYIFCGPNASTIGWRIENVSDSTSAEGTVSTNLPGAGVLLRGGFQLSTINTVSRNMRMQRVYIESDR